MRTMTDIAGLDQIHHVTIQHSTTEPPMSNPITRSDSDDAARRARVAELQRRRAATSRTSASGTDTPPTAVESASPATRAAARPPRAGVANGSKVAAAGFGFAAMLGLVAGMGYAGRSSAAPQPAPAPAAPAQVVVVIHPADGSAAQVGTPTVLGAVTASSSQPIVLSAQPTVRQAPVSQAPTGQTNGSR